MSVGQKLLTVVQNTPKVCQVVNSAKTTVTGTHIRISDALVGAPVITSGTVYGKNLADFKKASGRIAGQTVQIQDDSVVWKAGSNYFFQIPLSLPVGVTVSGSVDRTPNQAGERIDHMRLVYSDSSMALLLAGDTAYPVTTAQEVVALYLYKNTAATPLSQDLTVRNIQLELGSQSTDYTPFVEPETGVCTAKTRELSVIGGDQVSYFPETAADVWEGYQALRAAQQSLKEELADV